MDTVYREVNIEELARYLAEEAWSHEVKDVPETDKWQIDIVKRGGVLTVEKCIHDHWSSQYWAIKSAYTALIEQFTRKSEDNEHHKETGANQGAVVSGAEEQDTIQGD